MRCWWDVLELYGQLSGDVEGSALTMELWTGFHEEHVTNMDALARSDRLDLSVRGSVGPGYPIAIHLSR